MILSCCAWPNDELIHNWWMDIKSLNSDTLYSIMFRVLSFNNVASGLLYLQEETTNGIIHCNVKPICILLD